MDQHPTISLVTITLNAERHLEQAIASVVSQNYPALEYIVVDGGSKDRTLEIVRSHAGFVSRWISEPDDGISDAFNKGVKMATGEIIGILNADDYYHPSALDAVARAGMEYPDSDVYYGDAIHESLDGMRSFHFQPAQDLAKVIWKRMPISHPSTFVRRSAYARHGYYDRGYRYSMDYELILRMYLGGARFHYIPQVLSHFRFGRDIGSAGYRENRRLVIEHGQNPAVAWFSYFSTVGRAALKGLLRLN